MQFKKFIPPVETQSSTTGYAPVKNDVKKPDIYQVIEGIDKLVKNDKIAKEYRQEGGQ